MENNLYQPSSHPICDELDDLDAVKVAPKSHRIELENDEVRVLKIVISPGEKEPMHVHQWKSVMYVENAARIKYYDKDNVVIFESPETHDHSNIKPHVSWMLPEGIHSVENIDDVNFVALRIEIKNTSYAPNKGTKQNQ